MFEKIFFVFYVDNLPRNLTHTLKLIFAFPTILVALSNLSE